VGTFCVGSAIRDSVLHLTAFSTSAILATVEGNVTYIQMDEIQSTDSQRRPLDDVIPGPLDWLSHLARSPKETHNV
jgi:hypothetical protein